MQILKDEKIWLFHKSNNKIKVSSKLKKKLDYKPLF